jgi:hypothetical protein
MKIPWLLIKEEGPDPCPPPPQSSEESPCLAPENQEADPTLRNEVKYTQHTKHHMFL